MRVENDVPLVGACRRNGVVVGGESGVALRLPPQSKIADGWAEGVGLAAVIWRGMTPLWDWETCLPDQAWPERGWLPGRGAEMLAGAETGGVAGRSTTGSKLASCRDARMVERKASSDGSTGEGFTCLSAARRR